MSLDRDIRRVERYRDDIVTHGETAKAMTTVVETAKGVQRLVARMDEMDASAKEHGHLSRLSTWQVRELLDGGSDA